MKGTINAKINTKKLVPAITAMKNAQLDLEWKESHIPAAEYTQGMYETELQRLQDHWAGLPSNCIKGWTGYSSLFPSFEECAEKHSRRRQTAEAELKKAQADYNEAKETLDAALSSLQEKIDSVEGRCSTRCVSAYEMVDFLVRLEEFLNIPKVHLNGVKVHVDLYSKSFNVDYPWPDSTQYDAIYARDHWVITKISRDTCSPLKEKATFVHTEASISAIIKAYTHVYI